MNRQEDTPPSRSPAAEAAQWFIGLQTPEASREEREAFVDWLRRSPVHVEEFLQLTALHGDLTRMPGLRDINVDALLREAASQDGSDNVVPLGVGASAPQNGLDGPGRPGVSVKWRTAACLALAVAASVWAAGPVRSWLDTERFDTVIGEQRSFTLEDGSHVQLNVRSSLSAKVDESVRDIHLESGEALFQVARDARRPFRVHTPQAVIEAKGTQFNVHVKNGVTVVSLLEGRVEVRETGKASVVALDAGQEIVVAAHVARPPAPQAADLETAVAWTERRLVFEDLPLAEAIEEFNRYSRQPLAIEDPTLRNVRITASFDSGSVQTFADTLAAAAGLRTVRQPDGIWLIERR